MNKQFKPGDLVYVRGKSYHDVDLHGIYQYEHLYPANSVYCHSIHMNGKNMKRLVKDSDIQLWARKDENGDYQSFITHF